MRVLEDMGKIVISVFVTEVTKEDIRAMADDEQRSMSQMASILIDEAIKARAEAKKQSKSKK